MHESITHTKTTFNLYWTPCVHTIQLLSDLKCTSLLQVFRFYSWRWMWLGRRPSFHNSISSFKLCGRNMSNKWNTTGLLRSSCIHTPGPCAPAGRPTLNTLQKSAATTGQWWRLHVVLSLLHLARWDSPGFSLPAIWTKNWVLRSFTGPFSMDLNQDSEVLLSTSPNTPSRYKTEREELRHLHLPPGWPSLPRTPGGLGGWLFLQEPKQAWQKLPMSLLCL